MLEKNQRFKSLLYVLADAALLFIGFLLANYIRFNYVRYFEPGGAGPALAVARDPRNIIAGLATALVRVLIYGVAGIYSTTRLRGLAERCHACGCKLAAQIQPGDGRIGGPSVRYKVPISASACPWMHVPRMRCHALTIDEIHELEEDFRRSVQIALRSGADCVGIHAYGGYLTDQFLTRRWNTRTDAYGGNLENRARFLTELIAICKEEGGADFPVIVKFTPDHYMDGEGYRAIDEGIELAKLIVAAGADALHVDAGCHENWPNAMPPAGMQQMTLQSRSAKLIRSVVDVPVMTHGRFGDVDKAEAALRDGVCDIAVIGRGLLGAPDLPNKVLAGRPDTIRPCISCN